MFQIEPISQKMLDYYVGRQDVLIIDLRSVRAYTQSHIEGAVNIPYEELEDKNYNTKTLSKEKILILYCDRGGASLKAARHLARQGFKTRSVIGGFEAYRGRKLVISE